MGASFPSRLRLECIPGVGGVAAVIEGLVAAAWRDPAKGCLDGGFPSANGQRVDRMNKPGWHHTEVSLRAERAAGLVLRGVLLNVALAGVKFAGGILGKGEREGSTALRA